jgi:hypothetical protein
MTTKTIKAIGIFCILLSFTTSFALIAGPAKVIGIVRSYDDKSVSIDGEEAKYEVPKEFIAEKNLKAGAKIEVMLSQEQIEKVKIEKKKASKK